MLQFGLMGSSKDSPASTLLRALRAVISQVAEPSQVLRLLLDQAVTLTGADRGAFVEVAPGGELEFRVLHRFERSDLTGETGAFSRSIFAEALRSGEPVLLENALATPGFMQQPSVREMRLVSVLCVPVGADGAVAALIHLERNRPGHFTADHRALLASLVEVAGPCLEALQASRRVLREREDLRQAEHRIREELKESRAVLAQEWSFGRFVGRAAPVRELDVRIRKAAATDFPVLLVGETGTGKSIIARVLHASSARADRAFVTVFCPSLERGLVEAELFGHKRGAFTGATTDRVGKVQAADGGTLFLDEIGDLPLEIQPKILRLLQEKTYEKVGDALEARANVRIVAATNRDLDAEIVAGRFRRDLFERLNYVPIVVPPLRERLEDLPRLLRYCVDQHPSGRWVEILPEATDYLIGLDFSWPGNVRHVEQLAARIVMEGFDRPVGHDDVLRLLGGTPPAAGSGDVGTTASRRRDSDVFDPGLPALVARAEREWLERAIDSHPGLTRRELATRLKISEAALYKKLRQYGLGG